MSTQNTVRLHRVLTAKPEKVYRAFLEPEAMAPTTLLAARSIITTFAEFSQVM